MTNSQQFAFTDGKKPFPLVPLNSNGALCLTGSVATGALGSKACTAATAAGDEVSR